MDTEQDESDEKNRTTKAVESGLHVGEVRRGQGPSMTLG